MTSERDERNPFRTVEAGRRLDQTLRAVGDEILQLDAPAERGQSDRACNRSDNVQVSLDTPLALNAVDEPRLCSCERCGMGDDRAG
jgi:hypothetical protein